MTDKIVLSSGIQDTTSSFASVEQTLRGGSVDNYDEDRDRNIDRIEENSNESASSSMDMKVKYNSTDAPK